MNLSLALWSFLLLGVTQSHANELAERTRGRLEDEMAINGIDPLNGRRKLTLHTDFSVFEGTWYDCLHTTLMTFNGDPADKHNVEQVGCEGGELGTVTKVGNNDQTMQFVSAVLVAYASKQKLTSGLHAIKSFIHRHPLVFLSFYRISCS